MFVEHFIGLYGADDPAAAPTEAVETSAGESIFKCDTVEECAEQFNLDTSALRATVEQVVQKVATHTLLDDGLRKARLARLSPVSVPQNHEY